MSLSTWLSGTFSHSQARRAKRPNPATTSPHLQHTFRPRLEALEIRLTLSLTTLALFGAFPNGYTPVGGVIMDSSGNLYGTTLNGGANRDGTVFELASGSGTITTLASFNGTNGKSPQDALIMDSSGNLYGITSEGGASNEGTVFELAQGSGTITTRVSFNGSNGAYPKDALIMDSSGNLYGTTSDGGTAGLGTVFELSGADALPALRISGLSSSTGAGTSRTFTVPNAIGTTDTGHGGPADFTTNDRTANLTVNDTAPVIETSPLSGVVPQKKRKPSISDTLFSSIAGSLSADVS